jgi:hypothetical protein
MNFIDPYEKKQISFKSHKELDEYAYSLLKVKSQDKKEINNAIDKFLIEYTEDYHLLKAYDRAYWMVYLKLINQIENIEAMLNDNLEIYDDLNDENKKSYDDYKEKVKILKEKKIKYEPLCSTKQYHNNNIICVCFFGDPNCSKTL